MIQAIVSLYRAVIVAIFIAGAAFSAVIMLSGSWGFLIGGAVLGALVMAVGISAVLLSINDHLSALRPSASTPPDNIANADGSKAKGAIVAAVVVVGLAMAALYASGVIPKAERPSAISVGTPSKLKLGSSVKEGCVPELAAKAGMQCSE